MSQRSDVPVVYLSKPVILGKDRLPAGEGLYLHSNFIQPGHLFPIKILDNGAWNLLDLIANVFYPPDAISTLSAEQRKELRRLHETSIRYLVSRRLVNPDGSSVLDFAGARRWALVAAEPRPDSLGILGG